MSGTADHLRSCQLTAPVSVINLWWSSDNCSSHPPSRSVFSSYRPRRRNGLITVMRYGIFSMRWVSALRGSVRDSCLNNVTNPHQLTSHGTTACPTTWRPQISDVTSSYVLNYQIVQRIIDDYRSDRTTGQTYKTRTYVMPILRRHAARHEQRISSVTFMFSHHHGNVYMRVGVAHALCDSSDLGLLGEQSSQNGRFPALDADETPWKNLRRQLYPRRRNL